MATNAITENAPLSVLITGATGALAREVTRQLKAAGHRVTGATHGYENAALVRADGGIPAYPDLLRAGEIRSVMVAAKTDVVINLAPQIPNHLPQQPAHWDARLLDKGVAALEEAAQAAGVKFLVHTSYAFADAEVTHDGEGSGESDGEGSGESDEELEALRHALKAGEQKALNGAVPGCVLRMGFLYGAESPELIAVRNALMTGKMIDCGPDAARSCWSYIPDAARGTILAAQQRPAGALLSLVEDQSASPAAFLRTFAQSQGVSAPGRAPRFAAWAQPSKTQAALMQLSPHVSNAEAKEKLGWQPRFPTYHQGIDDLLLSWRTDAGVR